MSSGGYKLLPNDFSEKANPTKPRHSSRKSHSKLFQARYGLVFWAFCGFFIVYSLRVNLSVAIVSMVNSTAVILETPEAEECPRFESANSSYTQHKDGEFTWDEKTQGIILAAFFYGYIVTQVPGGWMAEVFGGKWLMGGGILCTAIFTLLTPIAARWSVPAFVIVRICAGLGEGVTFPAFYALAARWLPINERSTMLAITGNGANVGTVVTIPVAAFLCEHGFAGGWPSVFYVFGLLGCLWFVFWMVFVSDTPELHPRISKEELRWIIKNRDSCSFRKEIHYVPWKEIFTSGPVWALSISKLCMAWGFYTLLTELPNYLNVMLHFPIEKNGNENALIYVAGAITTILSGISADYLRAHNYLSPNVIRKTYQTIACCGPAICFALVPWLGCSPSSVITILILSMALMGFSAGGESPLVVDMAPDYAGTVGGITNGFGNLSGIFAPMFVGFLTQHNETMKAWGRAFYTSSVIFIIGALVFLTWGSAEPQPWAVTKDTSLSDLRTKFSEDEEESGEEMNFL